MKKLVSKLIVYNIPKTVNITCLWFFPFIAIALLLIEYKRNSKLNILQKILATIKSKIKLSNIDSLRNFLKFNSTYYWLELVLIILGILVGFCNFSYNGLNISLLSIDIEFLIFGIISIILNILIAKKTTDLLNKLQKNGVEIKVQKNKRLS